MDTGASCGVMVTGLIERILEWLFKYLPDCRETALDISRSMDQQTDFRKRFGMKLHLLTCLACRNYYKQLAFIRDTIRSLDDDADPPACDLSVEARQRLKTVVLM